MASGGAGDDGSQVTDGRKHRPIAERFQTAVAMIRSLPKEGPYMADNKTKLRFYALYKQATEGTCHGAKPGFWDVVGKAKWEAWSVCGNMNREIAMQLYVEELTEMVNKMPQTTEVTDFLESVSPFLPEEEEEEETEEEEEEEEGEEEEEEKEEGKRGEERNGELSSTVIHRVNEIELEDEEEEEGEGGGGGDEEEEESISSNENYQESFQDLQATSGDQSSPWQRVSPESLSHSFEVVNPDTPDNGISPAEDPFLSRLPNTTSSHLTGRGPSVVTLQHHGTGGEGVNAGIGSRRDPTWLTAPPVAMETVMRELRGVREKMESILQQLQALSHSVNQQLSQALPQTVSRDTSRQRRLKRVLQLSLLLLGWPLLLNFLISHFFRNAIILPLWMLSAISAAHVILSFLLRHYWGFPL